MQSDDVIWSIIDEQFCSFKTKFEKAVMCRNEYNVTGVCNRVVCPLANSRYATIKEDGGILYLHVKTIERAHSPANLWEVIELKPDLQEAMAQVNEQLAYWPKQLTNKVKERLVRLHQYLIRYRKYIYRPQPRLVPVQKKFEQREKVREMKALAAAKLEFAIKKELLERLQKGTYGGIYNENHGAFASFLKEQKLIQKLSVRNKSIKYDNDPQSLDKLKNMLNNADQIQEGNLSQLKFVADEEEDESEIEAEDEGEDEVDMEDFELENEDEIENEGEGLEGLEDDEREDVEQADIDDDDDELRADILKNIPGINLAFETGDDSEMRALKGRLLNIRKRKLQEKQDKSKKQHPAKKSRYGPRIEVEYENETETSTATNKH
eukprot:TRINITY_DN858_c0_g1_i2.p1 TRINITY_DN858_c0_g1~~TRINITY_DN858_c0_g1_i2.p1  ORF type:complete len:379 (-),score=103.21 TRINITY_DN858_c0_g1_i2:8-1144(-)